MVDAYIDIKYSNKRIQINYSLSIDIRTSFKTIGVSSSSSNFEEAKTKLKGLVKDSHEEEIIIKSKLYLKLKGYSKMGVNRLKEIKSLLSEQRPDITFKLVA